MVDIKTICYIGKTSEKFGTTFGPMAPNPRAGGKNLSAHLKSKNIK